MPLSSLHDAIAGARGALALDADPCRHGRPRRLAPTLDASGQDGAGAAAGPERDDRRVDTRSDGRELAGLFPRLDRCWRPGAPPGHRRLDRRGRALASGGNDLDDKLTIHPPFIDGTASKRAHEISVRDFGGDNALVVMLRGPQAAVERQGRGLAGASTRCRARWRLALVRRREVDGLSPSPGVAAIIVRTESEGDEVSALLPPVRR